MTVHVIALVTVNEANPHALARYLEATMPLLDSVGARIVQRFEIGEAVVGDVPAQMVMVVEYPDRAAVDQVFQSDTYRDIRAVRDQAFLTYKVSLVTNQSDNQTPVNA